MNVKMSEKMNNQEQTEQSAQENTLLASRSSQSVGDYIRGYFQRIRSGDLGAIPIIFGLIVIAVIFQTQNENFLTPRNFVSLILQMAGITTIAYGVVFVLLLGEIDLSVGYVSAVGGVGMTNFNSLLEIFNCLCMIGCNAITLEIFDT